MLIFERLPPVGMCPTFVQRVSKQELQSFRDDGMFSMTVSFLMAARQV